MKVDLQNKKEVYHLGDEINVDVYLTRDYDEDTLSPVHSLYFPSVSFIFTYHF